MELQNQTDNIIISYNNNFLSNSNNGSLLSTRRDVITHTRNHSLPFPMTNNKANQSSTSSNVQTSSHRRVFSARSLSQKNSNSNSKIDPKNSFSQEIQDIINSIDSASDTNSLFSSTSNISHDDNNHNDHIDYVNHEEADESSELSQIYTRNASNSTLLSPSSSIRSVHHFTHIHQKRFSRTIQHISSFLQINANISSKINFPVTIEKSFTVERLARQIEAEYAFKFGGIETVIQHEPLEVGLLYDVSMVALRFRDLVGDVLEHGDTVHVLNIYESYHPRLDQEDESEFDNLKYIVDKDLPPIPPISPNNESIKEKRLSLPNISSNNVNNDNSDISDNIDEVIPSNQINSSISTPNSPEILNSSSSSLPSINQIQNTIQASESRFQAVLANTLSLNYFQKFAIREFSAENLLFWLEVELFAAGVSCDIENNYYEEQQSAVIYARYIFLTYICVNAPLQVNLSDEIRREIAWPIDDDCEVERNMFDEAQEAVYQLMRGHTFIRFEESPEWKECLSIKKTGIGKIFIKISYDMIEPLEKYFRPNMSLMLVINNMSLNNSSEQAPISHHFKEQTLHSTLSQYFPETILLDNKGERIDTKFEREIKGVDGYFDVENRMTNAQRMRRMKKERKLQWVFGEKVGRIEDQIIVLPKENLYGNGKIGFGEDDDFKSAFSIDSVNRKMAKEVWNRKKRVEKLESIFGRGLKDSQTTPNIFKSKKNSAPTIITTHKMPQTLGLNVNDTQKIRTTNELNKNDKRILRRKNRKLKVILGENFDENMVYQTLAQPAIQSPTPTKIPKTGKSSFYVIMNIDTKEYRRKKLQKLNSFLGERVPIDIALGKEADFKVVPLPPVPKPKNKRNGSNSFYSQISPTRLSAIDRRRHLNRAVKLEKMFGEIPPQDLILSKSPVKNDPGILNLEHHRRSIVSLEYLMDNDRDAMFELINYMADSDGNNDYEDRAGYSQGSASTSAPTTPYVNFSSSPPRQNVGDKQERLKSNRKLSHFFGASYGQMFPDQILGELLYDLEREIREEARQSEKVDKTVVEDLMGQIDELRVKSNGFGPVGSEDEIGEDDTSTGGEDTALTDDELTQSIRKRLELNKKKRVVSRS
ncbi:2950_t:CDS:2 [Diversispora eburnea]|uniref:2950_t:CDS:1 n=1 Tax=Diversispora eburnea TaxID=1213867 RepID=A0A9N8YP09_9GLOM|nr:2950_t:CDS:2 [Diversispora eburnea]